MLNRSAFFITVLLAGATASAQFTSSGVSLHAQIDLNTFAAGSGNDCWGYVSPSGREYALMGCSNKVAFVEISDPGNPNWFASVPHTNSSWGDIKVYKDVAYAVTEASGTGIQVMDLSDIDNHNVTLLRTLSAPSSNHNIAIDTDSGFLYTCGSRGGSSTSVVFDLSDPRNPVEVDTWSTYEHDAQIVTYTSGPFAGREIMFGASEGRGLDVIDVTDKSNTFLISRTPYANVAYCHQVWTEDLHYLYVNDELDSIPRTIVFDISDLNSPIVVSEFTNGTLAIDHNNYVRDGVLYTASYHAGMRMFDLSNNPTNPAQIGWFDTYPEDDGDGFDGAWSVYPFFPSRTVIVSDIDRGLFILDVGAAIGGFNFTHPNGLPEFVDPSGGTTVRVELSGRGGTLHEPGTGKFFYDAGVGFIEGQMNEVSPNVYDAVFPAIDCGVAIAYYFTAESTGGELFTDPLGAPGVSYDAVSASGIVLAFHDNFETNMGWTVENLGATSGDWERGVPVNDPAWAYDPTSDSDGSGQCFLTENELGNSDIDDGAVRLTSPLLDMAAGGSIMSYDYFLNMTNPSGVDRLLVEIDGNGGTGPWTEIARHETDGGLLWRTHEITETDLLAAGVTPTATMRMRFTANDDNPASIVESGLDAFKILAYECNSCYADCDQSTGVGVLDVFDFLCFQNSFVNGEPYACDCDTSTGVGVCDVFDFLCFQDAFVGGCP